MIEQWLGLLSELIAESYWLAPALALLAGILTSFMPCALSSVPLVIGYVGGVGNKDPKRSFKLSLVFALGMAITFTALGTAASLLGKLIGTSGSWWYIALGVLMVLMALQIFEIYNFIPSTYLTDKNTRRGYAGALLTGILGGFFFALRNAGFSRSAGDCSPKRKHSLGRIAVVALLNRAQRAGLGGGDISRFCKQDYIWQ